MAANSSRRQFLCEMTTSTLVLLLLLDQQQQLQVLRGPLLGSSDHDSDVKLTEI